MLLKYSLALHTKAHIYTNVHLMTNKIESIVTVQHIRLCTILLCSYLLYPTVHFQNLGRIVQGLDIFLGIKTLCHSLLVMLVFDFPSAQKSNSRFCPKICLGGDMRGQVRSYYDALRGQLSSTNLGQ